MFLMMMNRRVVLDNLLSELPWMEKEVKSKHEPHLQIEWLNLKVSRVRSVRYPLLSKH